MNRSLLPVETRASYPLITEQRVRGAVQASAPKAAKANNPTPGRPKGRANQNRQDVALSPFQTQRQGGSRAALKLAGKGRISINAAEELV